MMTRLHKLFIVAILAGAGIACARQTDPAADPALVRTYSYAFATPDCAPWDGPAVVLYLLDSNSDAVPPVTRHVRVAIWKGQTELAHHTFRWPSQPPSGEAARCTATDSCEAATEGQIAIGAADRDKAVDGDLDLRFANGDRVKQTFKAVWRPRRIFCG